uniref:tRNA (guanine(37)-N1)-methyltransferase n=1 Tax=Oryza barthii TaxID=65489 RepID=A0A0D3EP42_9ORYZ
MAPPLLDLPSHCLLPRLRRPTSGRLLLHLRLKPLSSSSYTTTTTTTTTTSSSTSSSRAPQVPPSLHGPSLRRGRRLPGETDGLLSFARIFDLAALRVPAAACAPLERRLRGHLLNWPRVRNVVRQPGDDGGLLFPVPHPSLATPSSLPTAVARREKLAREFNARGFVQFPNLAKMSRPPARKRKGKKDEGGGEAAATARDTKDKVYVVEVIGERKEEHGDEWMGLVGEEGFGRITWRGGPTRLLLLDENYANKRVDDLPEAIKVVLDHETNKDGSSSYELVQCQLTLFYNYWPMNEILEEILPEGIIVPTGFETVGHIAHLNLRDDHLPYKKLIAQVVLDKNKPKIQTVVNKIDAIQNDYRTMQLEVLAGIDSLVTTVIESGLRFQVDLSTVYWNSRLSTERQRLVDHVFKNSDVVCDVFSGVGPIAISAARKVKYVYANDLNPTAVEYLERNIVLNKLERKIEVFNMDARRFISSIYSSQHVHPVTQVVMNLPNDAAEFLDVFRGISWNHQLAVPSCVMPNIHVYGFSKAEDPEYDFHERINLTLGENVSDVEMHRVRLVAPGKWMLCASFTLPSRMTTRAGAPLAVFLVSSLKSAAARLRHGEQLHALAAKSGLLASNLFVRNSLLAFYSRVAPSLAYHLFDEIPPLLRDATAHNILLSALARAGRLERAQCLLAEMPQRDAVSFTTVISALSRSGHPERALAVFRDMLTEAVQPNEVTLAEVLTAMACDHGAPAPVGAAHGVAVRRGLDGFVIVATNLVHAYGAVSQVPSARSIFELMPDRNTVTWNTMLNCYVKAGMINMAAEVFGVIPERDEALRTYVAMVGTVGIRANEVILVGLVKACSRHSAVSEGQQLHTVILKNGFDAHAFVQATLIHYYGSCDFIDHAQMQFKLSDKSHVASWNALMASLLRRNLVHEARQLFDDMPERDTISWSTLISGYVQSGNSNMALQIFCSMLDAGVEPNEITLASALSAVANSGTLGQARWIHDYIISRSIQLTDKLSAGLINVYAKCGSIAEAVQLFNHVKDKSISVSPWNSIICNLAIHGYVNMSLELFSQLQSTTNIKPNSITYLGVLNACCHAGMVAEGKRQFESMRQQYGIQPEIKHYGCMVDLLCRAGYLEEAELLIKTMPMKADVVAWGCILAAARTQGNVALGEKAAEELSKLDPSHGASKIALSNLYADAGHWSNVSVVRKELQNENLERLTGSSGILQL